MPDPIEKRWPEFVRVVSARLQKGRDTYGDQSFERPPSVLVGELEAEAADIAGWGFVLWCRLRALREAAERAEKGQG